MNPTDALNALPVKIRRTVYASVGIVAIVVGCATAGFVAIGHANPVWLAFAAGALVPLTVASNAIALSNSTAKPDAVPAGGLVGDDEEETDDEDEADPAPTLAEQLAIEQLTAGAPSDNPKPDAFAEQNAEQQPQ